MLALSLGVTVAIVAWGYLVFLAIDFGSSARSGDNQAWIFVAIASLGAVACLFLALILASRVLRAIGATAPLPEKADDEHPWDPETAPPAPGGRRAAR